jgi:sarcosine oxidase subunit gamma
MKSSPRTSPLHAALARLTPRWGTHHGMPVPIAIGDPAREKSFLDTMAISDLSSLRRCGLKGPRAEAWLTEQQIALPPEPNQWQPIGQCGLIARLATSEFFIEDGPGTDQFSTDVMMTLGRGQAGVTPVPRQDAEIVVAGAAAQDLLVQTCSVNFAALDLDQRPLVMTSMIGVSVLVIPGTLAGLPIYQIWCDPTFAPYLWEHTFEIAQELDGGAVGLCALFPNFLREDKT